MFLQFIGLSLIVILSCWYKLFVIFIFIILLQIFCGRFFLLACVRLSYINLVSIVNFIVKTIVNFCKCSYYVYKICVLMYFCLYAYKVLFNLCRGDFHIKYQNTMIHSFMQRSSVSEDDLEDLMISATLAHALFSISVLISCGV